MAKEWEVPTEWWVVNSAGTAIQVDKDVAREVSRWITVCESPREVLTVDTILGETIDIVADAVNHIYNSTPETRRRSRMIDEMLKAERKEQGFLDDDL